MNTPLVSIIVPVYKVEQYLHTCIDSVLQQKYAPWELILVDDGSPDRCGEICEEYAQKDDRIRVVHKENGGLSSARNAGLDVMRGEYVTFLDSDDFWHRDYLTTLMGYILREGADIVQCDFVRGTATTFPECEQEGGVMMYNRHTIFTSQAAKIIMWGKVYKASYFAQVRMPVGYINEDDWTTWKLYDQAAKIVVTDQPLYYYTVNPNSIMGKASKKPDLTYWGAYEERIAYYEKKAERDLEDMSRMQFAKSLLMLYSNDALSDEERKCVKRTFDEQWQSIAKSAFVPRKLKIVFYGFYKCPSVTSRVVTNIHTGGKN